MDAADDSVQAGTDNEPFDFDFSCVPDFTYTRNDEGQPLFLRFPLEWEFWIHQNFTPVEAQVFRCLYLLNLRYGYFMDTQGNKCEESAGARWGFFISDAIIARITGLSPTTIRQSKRGTKLCKVFDIEVSRGRGNATTYRWKRKIFDKWRAFIFVPRKE